jgi:hypothetical protein
MDYHSGTQDTGAHMNYSPPSLHGPVLNTQALNDLLRNQLSSIAERRFSARVQQLPTLTAASIDIPITTVSRESNFDAFIQIGYRGAATLSDPFTVDSGSSSLIVPDFNVIAKLPNFKADYTILADKVAEPWGCPAVILRGPIEIPAKGGGFYEIPDCVFYACTGPNVKGKFTANFGVGCVSPWATRAGITIKAPLAYIRDYPYAEFNYAPAAGMFAAGREYFLAENSLLTLYKNMPRGYKVFDIIKNLAWMSLTPRSLSIGGTKTKWPGKLEAPIAMVDTGGGPVFLSDPLGNVYRTNWPAPAPSPDWTKRSVSCQSIKNDIVVVLGDANGSFSYHIDPTTLPASVQGLTLVMCEQCEYMWGKQGMNTGGISALFNYILIDYASARVAFKAKALELAEGIQSAPASS